MQTKMFCPSDRRMRGLSDTENGFRIEGIFEIDLTSGGGRGGNSDRGECVVTRARHARELRAPRARDYPR